MGPIRIAWYIERYNNIKTFDATVCRVCKKTLIPRVACSEGLVPDRRRPGALLNGG
jgi:hypothetical protein